MAHEGSGDFSKLEAGFAEIKIERRRISVEVQGPWRHAKPTDLVEKDLDVNYEDVDARNLPLNHFPSLQGILPALQYSSHLANENNFADETTIDCFDQTADGVTFSTLDDTELHKVLDTIEPTDVDVNVGGNVPSHPESLPPRSRPSPTRRVSSQEDVLGYGLSPTETLRSYHLTSEPLKPLPPSNNRSAGALPSTTEKSTGNGRLLVFFVPLTAKKDTSFGWQASMQRASVQKLFDTLGVNPEFMLNFLGRPDYWSPRTRWQSNKKDELIMCDYYCQHPRWNLQVQGAPLSVYVLQHLKTKLTTYIITHKTGDTSVHVLQQLLRAGVELFDLERRPSISLTNPFEIAVLLSTLSFEASKHHVARFRRYMWEQVNKVDDHLAGLENSDRSRLTELTKSLQIISQQADSHLLNANIALATARGTRDAQARLHDHLGTPTVFRQAAEDAVKYVIDSMEKQKMLFLNYKSRKDGTMSLVYNLVTQGDAANNIELARSMKRDSTSMSAIAALTMLFLPGTFTSSLLSAGIFSSETSSNNIYTSALWWLFVATTVPLTLVVMGAWWMYRRHAERAKQQVPESEPELKHQATWPGKIAFDTASLFRRRKSSVMDRNV